MASVAGPNSTNPILEILKANGINPDMQVSQDDGTQRSAFEILEAAVVAAFVAALDEIEELNLVKRTRTKLLARK